MFLLFKLFYASDFRHLRWLYKKKKKKTYEMLKRNLRKLYCVKHYCIKSHQRTKKIYLCRIRGNDILTYF